MKLNMQNRLKEIRTAVSLSQAAFSRKIGISQTSLALMELGQRNITKKTQDKICSVFGVNENWFLTGEGEMFDISPLKMEFLDILDGLSTDSQELLLNLAKDMQARTTNRS